MKSMFFLARCRYITVVAMVSASLFGCANVAEMAGYSTETLNQEAAKNYTQVVNVARAKNALDTNSPTAKRVRAVFNRMVPYANQANKTGTQFDWKLNVIRSNELNAWAMPGGKMVMYTGIVNQLKLTDDEIAAIMGHEMTHSLEEHSKQAVGQQVLTGLAMNVGGQVLASKTNMSSDSIDLAKNILSQYGIGLPFSRHQESEADAGGLKLMAQAGYNPSAALSVWNKMNQVQDNNNIIDKITSTHPTNNDRISAINKLLPQMMQIYQQSLQNKPVVSLNKQSKTSKGKKK